MEDKYAAAAAPTAATATAAAAATAARRIQCFAFIRAAVCRLLLFILSPFVFNLFIYLFVFSFIAAAALLCC